MIRFLESDGSHLLAGADPGGLYESTNGASAWIRVGAKFGIDSVTSIGVARQDSRRLVLGGNGPFLRASSDGGRTWKSTILPDVQRIVSVTFDSKKPTFAYASADARATGFGSAEGRLFRSADGGDTWTEIKGWPARASAPALAPDEHQAGVVYAGTYSIDRRRIEVLESRDFGETWNIPANGLDNRVTALLCLKADPTVSGTVYAGTGSGLYVSRDAATTWKLSHGSLPAEPIFDVFPDPKSGGTVYVALYSGVYVSTDGASTWQRLASDLIGVPFSVVARGTDSSVVAYAGTAGGGVHTYRASEKGWQPAASGLAAQQVNAAAWHPRDPQVVYAGGVGGIWKSTDRGRNWCQVWGASDTIAQIAIDPTRPDIVYAVGVGVWKSIDGGISWSHLPLGVTNPSPYSRNLLVSPSDPQVLYCIDTGLVEKSDDGGQTWRGLQVETPLRLPYNLGGDIAFHTTKTNVLYCTKYGVGVFRSDDDGESWTRRPGAGLLEKNVNGLAVDPSKGDTLLAATYDGVYRSIDGGASWKPAGLDGWDVSSISISQDDGRLVYAGTYASRRGTGGVFKSVDGGTSWRMTSDGLPPKHRDIWRIVQSPSDRESVLAVSFEGGLFVSGSANAGGHSP